MGKYIFTFIAVVVVISLFINRQRLRVLPATFTSEFALQPLKTLAPIFASDHTWVATLSAEKTTTLLVTGDVLTARTVNAKTIEKKDFTWAWQKTTDQLKQADITYINLETPLISNCPVKNDGMIFCGDVRHIEGLKFAGVDVINFANNHAGNQGLAGVNQTVHLLEQNDFLVSGVHGPVYKKVKHQTWAFLGYNEVDLQPGVNLAQDELIIREINEAQENADIVVVQFHWGIEYTHQPSTNQKRLAYLAIDHGANLIVSNHPHWWQAVEMYKDKLIMYSHGNFIFDQMWSEQTRTGVVGKYTFYDDQLIDVEFLPVYITDFGQPQWLTGEKKQRVLDALKIETAHLSTSNF